MDCRLAHLAKKVVVIGGTGHVGSYLIPRLAASPAYEVICVSRGKAKPYPAGCQDSKPDQRWDQVRRMVIDRDSAGFYTAIAAMRPDVVIDMVCFTLAQCKELVNALLPLRNVQLIHTGSIWAYGPTVATPTTEDGPHGEPLAEYGRCKREIANYLLDLIGPASQLQRVVFHPGHICGRGWPPLNPQGNFDPRVFDRLRRGETVALPNLGMESVHHVHADDIASAFIAAIEKPDVCNGEVFNIVSPQALTLRRFAEKITAEIWPREAPPPPTLQFVPLPADISQRSAFESTCDGPASVELSFEHIRHSPCCSVDKLHRILGVRPKWSSLAAVADAVRWMDEQGVMETIAFPGQDTRPPLAGAGQKRDRNDADVTSRGNRAYSEE